MKLCTLLYTNRAISHVHCLVNFVVEQDIRDFKTGRCMYEGIMYRNVMFPSYWRTPLIFMSVVCTTRHLIINSVLMSVFTNTGDARAKGGFHIAAFIGTMFYFFKSQNIFGFSSAECFAIFINILGLVCSPVLTWWCLVLENYSAISILNHQLMVWGGVCGFVLATAKTTTLGFGSWHSIV